MKITCPNCTTSYQVPDDYIGAEGRSVRCANCGETWHAEQPGVEQDIEGEFDASQDDIDALFDSPGGGDEQSQDDIDALFDSPGGGDEQSQDDIDALFDSPGGGDEQSQDDIDALFDSPGGGDEQNQDDIDALFDSPGGGEEQNQDDIDALFDSPSEGEEQNQDDIDALFDSPASEGSAGMSEGSEAGPASEGKKGSGVETVSASPPSPFVVEAGDSAHREEGIVDLMDAAAFEVQKKLARGKDIESSARHRRRRKGAAKDGDDLAGLERREWVIGGSALGASAALLALFLLLPGQMVGLMPDLAGLYRIIGMDVNLGGVDFDAVDVRIERKGGAPVIAVDAEVVNPGVDPVLMPAIQLSVLGNDDIELYSWIVGPDGVGLGPGERQQIKTSVAAPSQAKKLKLKVSAQE